MRRIAGVARQGEKSDGGEGKKGLYGQSRRGEVGAKVA